MLRKKNIVLTAEASAAIAAGADPAAVTEELPETPATEPETPAAEAQAAAPKPDDNVTQLPVPAAAAAAATEEETETVAPAAAASDDSVSVLAAQLKSTSDELVDTKVSLKEATGKLTTLEASQAGLVDIAIEATQKFQVALGFMATDMSNLTADAVITQYRTLQPKFNEAFGIGAKAQIPVDDDRNAQPPAPAGGATRATSFRKEDK